MWERKRRGRWGDILVERDRVLLVTVIDTYYGSVHGQQDSTDSSLYCSALWDVPESDM